MHYKCFLFLSIFLFLLSCSKEEQELPADNYIFLFGKWNVEERFKIYNSDTSEHYKNGVFYDYWYGIIQQENYTGKIEMEFQINNKFVFLQENIKDTIEYTSDWAFKNSDQQNTFIEFDLMFDSHNLVTVAKIIKLTENELIFEHSHNYTGDIEEYLYYHLKKVDDVELGKDVALNNSINNKVIGKWKLVSLYDSTYLLGNNLFVYNAYANHFVSDTLYTESPSSEGWPPIYILGKNSFFYSLLISVESEGEFSSHIIKNMETKTTHGYWYWKSQDKIYFNPMSVLDFDYYYLTTDLFLYKYYPFEYNIKYLDNNKLVIYSEYYCTGNQLKKVFYEFKREN